MPKIAMVNKSGSVGKTTLSAHLIAPRLDDVKFYALESSNLTASEFGIKVKTFDSTQFKETVRDSFHYDNAVFDVGGSKNFTDFYGQMQDTDTGHLNFDYFVIPAIADEKAEKETLDTIISLLKLGVEPEKMRIVYNKVKPLTEFTFVPGAAEKYNIKTATVKDSPVFTSLLSMKITIPDMLAIPGDAKEWRAKAAAAKKGSVEFNKAYELYFAKDMLSRVIADLDKAWIELEIA